MADEYGIVANIITTDGTFRSGAKCWLVGGTGGEGWHRFQWLGKSRGGRDIQKWAPTKSFHRFRAAWIPDHVHNGRYVYMMGTRDEMEKMAFKMEAFAQTLRAKTNAQSDVPSTDSAKL